MLSTFASLSVNSAKSASGGKKLSFAKSLLLRQGLITVLIVGLACLSLDMVGCSQADTVKTDVGKSETTKLEPEKPVKENPADERINKLIRQLGDDDWRQREAAQKELTQLGEKLIDQYRKLKAVASSEDRVARKKPSSLTTHYSLLKEFADALREASQDKAERSGVPTNVGDPEIRMRANQIRQHLYDLTQPKIAFYSDRDGDWEIYVMPVRPSGGDADGNNQKRLTENTADDMWLDWSPDGTKITFNSTRDGNHEIYVMDADGKNQKRLTQNQVSDWSPAWSPDGTKIAFVSYRDGNWEIYVMDADGENQKNLTKNQAGDEWSAWSPDGTKIAFGSDRDSNYEIYVMDADGKNQKRLTENKAKDWSPAWSPDGTKIAFASERDGNDEIYVMDANGKNQQRLTENQADDSGPAWSPSSLPEISALFSSPR